jgi:hypothetical protein
LTGSVGWRDEFLRVATVLCDFIGADPSDVLGDGLASLDARLSASDDKAIRAEVEHLLAEARAKQVDPVAAPGF